MKHFSSGAMEQESDHFDLSLSLSRCRGTLHPLSTISLSLSIEDSVHRGALVRLWNVSHPFWSKIADELLTSSKKHRFWLEYPMCRRINEHQRSSIDRSNGCLQSKWLINDECRRRSAWYRSKVRFFVRLKIDVLDLILDRIIRMIWRCAVFRSSMWNQYSWFSNYFVFLSNWILTSEDVQLPKMSKNRSKKEKKSTAKALSRCHELPSERTRTKHRENAPEVGNVWQPKKMTTRMNRRMGRKWWKKENQSTEKRNDPTNRSRQSDDTQQRAMRSEQGRCERKIISWTFGWICITGDEEQGAWPGLSQSHSFDSLIFPLFIKVFDRITRRRSTMQRWVE